MAKAKKSPILPIVIVVAVLAVLGIVGYLLMNKGGSSMGLKKGAGTFTSIKDALSKSVSLECEYKDAAGNSTKSYIKNGAIRADIVAVNDADSGSMIMKDKKMYFWHGNKGYMMEIPDTEEGEDIEINHKNSKEDEFLDEMEQYKNQCKASVVSDGLFTPPSDVDFASMSEMMPSGMPQMDANGQMNEEDVQKYMEQYQGNSEYSDQ